MRPYSTDLRRRVVAACDRKDGRRVEIAERLGVCTAWIRRLLQRRRETGSMTPLPQNAGRKPALDNRKLERLRRLVATYGCVADLLTMVPLITAELRRLQG